jgi:hypothetical protein
MPTLNSTDKLTPRSILRHRPIDGEPTTDPGRKTKKIQLPGGINTPVPRASRLEPPMQEKNVAAPEKENVQKPEVRIAPGSRKTRKINDPAATALPVSPASDRNRNPKIAQDIKRVRNKLPQLSVTRYYAIFFVLIGMIIMLVLWVGGSVAGNWFATWHDDLLYGRPRTFQIDARVGHNEQNGVSSHFIAENFNRRILVIEMPGGDASKARVFIGPQLYGSNDDLLPVTLAFQDVNHDHKLDMIIKFGDTRIIYLNTGTTFRPLLPSEQSQLAPYLQQVQ